ncbi:MULTISPECIES: DUF6745 domain-containing protein [Cyanophyceae]|uniref:DUF6745 domain-containing protein n=1 Tax=Cyanophyceae TaxID=3028117 RepID=UPI0016898FF4|nr:hypothetical protein [Trichocoleus sp. FACHB-40]MBD2006834.1 hypothetical protein [Trichocoleus sp. FACHB-40]
MSQKKIEKLTPEQEALIPLYRDKWRNIAYSTEPIDREKAAEAVKEAYNLIALSEPKIIFCDSPYSADNQWLSKESREFTDDSYGRVSQELEYKLWDKLMGQLWEKMRSYFETEELHTHLHNQVSSKIGMELGFELSIFGYCLDIEEWSSSGVFIEFCVFVLNLNCTENLKEWIVFQSIVKNCGWIYPYEKIAIICDRPRVLSLDNQQRLHAEGSPAIQFADGYSLYAYHGVRLPEKYGTVHPNQWQPQWLLEENNAELRQVLIQGIGYERIAQELGAIELDSYQEYSLLKIDIDVDVEPISLLKMTCPSTGFIHALRVPPEMISAREAIRWVNWGISPEEFAIQT